MAGCLSVFWGQLLIWLTRELFQVFLLWVRTSGVCSVLGLELFLSVQQLLWDDAAETCQCRRGCCCCCCYAALRPVRSLSSMLIASMVHNDRLCCLTPGLNASATPALPMVPHCALGTAKCRTYNASSCQVAIAWCRMLLRRAMLWHQVAEWGASAMTPCHCQLWHRA